MTKIFAEIRNGDVFYVGEKSYMKLDMTYNIIVNSCCNPPMKTRVNAVNYSGSLVFFRPDAQVTQ